MTLTLFQYKYPNYKHLERYINSDCMLIVQCFSDGVGFEQKNDYISYINTRARTHTHARAPARARARTHTHTHTHTHRVNKREREFE